MSKQHEQVTVRRSQAQTIKETAMAWNRVQQDFPTSKMSPESKMRPRKEATEELSEVSRTEQTVEDM